MPPLTVDEARMFPACRELDAKIAVVFFGWRWMQPTFEDPKTPRMTALIPPANLSSASLSGWEPSDAEALRYADWDKMFWRDLGDANDPYVSFHQGFPRYSSKVNAAFELVEKLAAEYHWEIKSPFREGSPWVAGLTPLGVTGWNGRPDYQAPGQTMPLAVCRAALVLTVERQRETEWQAEQNAQDDKNG